MKSFSSRNMSEIEEVSVVEVYEIASEIGAECEKLIELYGANSVTQLIQKCIFALEMLEHLASKNEHEASVVQELNEKIQKLENEKQEKAETKRKFEKEIASEIASVEEAWRGEVKELVSMVSRLQAENQRLSKKESDKNSSDSSVSENNKFDESIIRNLEDKIDTQRNEIRQKNVQLQEKLETIEQHVKEIEQQKHQNAEVKKRSKLLQNQVKVLCEERADFLAKIQDQHREVLTLKKRLGITEKENEDCDKADDSTIPRFTMAELKEFLAERNELRNRVNDLEEELMACKPIPISPPGASGLSLIEDDAPVQGPLPEEWYNDELWKKKNSDTGIRKFFRKLFSETDGGFPKRSLSSLTKMALSGSSGPHTEIPI